MKNYNLVKVKDPGLPTYTWFWSEKEIASRVSPFFNSEEESILWMNENKDKLEKEEIK
jgi:hypothetical protein